MFGPQALISWSSQVCSFSWLTTCLGIWFDKGFGVSAASNLIDCLAALVALVWQGLAGLAAGAARIWMVLGMAWLHGYIGLVLSGFTSKLSQ